MGWSINLLENSVVVPEAAIVELYKAGKYYFWGLDSVLDEKGYLIFDNDAMEHMDYLHDSLINKILCAHKVSGRIAFSSADGDNRGQYWSYDFDGNGGMTETSGKIKDLMRAQTMEALPQLDSQITGKKIVFTGKLETMTRAEAEGRAQALGADVESSVTSATDLLVAGPKAGSKLDKAVKLGIRVINEEAWDKIRQDAESNAAS